MWSFCLGPNRSTELVSPWYLQLVQFESEFLQSFRIANCILFYSALPLPCCPTCNVSAVINQVCCCRQPLYSVIKAILCWSKRRTISEDEAKALQSFLLSSPKLIPFKLPVSSVDVESFEKALLPSHYSTWRRSDKTPREGDIAQCLTCSTQTPGLIRLGVQEMPASKYSKHDLPSLKKVMSLLSRLCLSCTCNNPYKEQGVSSENSLYHSGATAGWRQQMGDLFSSVKTAGNSGRSRTLFYDLASLMKIGFGLKGKITRLEWLLSINKQLIQIFAT